MLRSLLASVGAPFVCGEECVHIGALSHVHAHPHSWLRCGSKSKLNRVSYFDDKLVCVVRAEEGRYLKRTHL